MFLGKLAFIFLIATIISVAYAQEIDPVSSAVRSELAKRFEGARVELTDDIHWNSAQPEGEIRSVSVGQENARAQVQFTVQSQGTEGPIRSYGWVSFAAYLPARVVVHRVMPGEALQADQFGFQDVNVASGQFRDLRGLILPQTDSIAQMEARQTLVEGQPLLSSAIEKIPDVRRGDPVRVKLISGDLTLSTLGTASEPAYMNGVVRVLTQKTKRELAGKLVASGVVEVRL